MLSQFIVRAAKEKEGEFHLNCIYFDSHDTLVKFGCFTGKNSREPQTLNAVRVEQNEAKQRDL